MQNTSDQLTDSETPTKININQIIPPELLVLILDSLYTEAIASIPLVHTKYPPLDHHPLLVMMLVCKSWHQLITNTPTFWTLVCIGAGTGLRDVDKEGLKRALGRSGQLPLMAIIAPERLPRFQVVHEALHSDDFQRFSTLAFVVPDRIAPTLQTTGEDILQLLQNPLPSLKRLHVGRLRFDPKNGYVTLQITIDAPELRELSFERHFIFPEFPSRLTSLSITSVSNNSLGVPLTPGCLEIPLLLDLCISECNPTPFLLAFITPSLRRLVVTYDVSTIDELPPPLRAYPNLEELQWSDRGPDQTFSTLLPLCPNLTRYSNYLIGREDAIKFQYIDTPATILSLLPNDGEARATSSWPKLEEVLLDVGRCSEITILIDAIPSIQRVRVLKSFASLESRIGEEDEKLEEEQLLPSLRQKVDLAFWLDPWGSSPGENGCG
ncbi:hypothetical protein FRC04_011441 [Tulasnella sp. 424]|nr:hypothetical protein FRC04_011441 [Tulasnella sp. 424]KAG8971963.1 hypothetical protein FRC05_010498 [Tulasnella sp. 425]